MICSVRSNQRQQSIKGFTLLEILLVLAIIASIAVFAIPNLHDFQLRSHRTDAKATLLELSNRQESYYANNLRYADEITALGQEQEFSLAGYYSLSLTSEDGYTLKAIVQGSQTADIECWQFSLNSLGQRKAINLAQEDTSEQCW